MARKVSMIQEVKEDERWKKCPHCQSIIAYNDEDIFLLWRANGIHSAYLRCPECTNDFRMGYIRGTNLHID